MDTSFTVADFYGAWHELKMEMEVLAGVALVDNIIAEMNTRETDMMQNDVIYSCVFMDPRYRILLNEGKSLQRNSKTTKMRSHHARFFFFMSQFQSHHLFGLLLLSILIQIK